MTTPIPAVGARPGTFFVDRPDGFVWWVTSQRAPSGVGFRWARFYGLRAADWDYATQEEAEAAGLVAVVADDGRIATLNEIVDVFGGPLVDPVAKARELVAPLNPRNPEHLRQVADVLEAMPGETFQVAWESLNERIFRLEDAAAKKARGAEQDASDRKRAEEIACAWKLSKDAHAAHVESVLAGIRAERARQAVEK